MGLFFSVLCGEEKGKLRSAYTSGAGVQKIFPECKLIVLLRYVMCVRLVLWMNSGSKSQSQWKKAGEIQSKRRFLVEDEWKSASSQSFAKS